MVEQEISLIDGLRGLSKMVDDVAEVESLRRELARAHAAMHWCATVRAVVISGMLRAHGEDAQRGLLNIMAVAHATAEVWLSGARVTAEAVAHLLGWHAPHSALAVAEWLRPLQEGPHPPLITADGQPNIKVGDG
jgi:hypothetical protein